VYPGYRSNIPSWVYEYLIERAGTELSKDSDDLDFTRGPLISRFSFTIDVREWGFADPRHETIRQARNDPAVRAITAADVWDERADDRPGSSDRTEGQEDEAYV
jgi:hypothetical protein